MICHHKEDFKNKYKIINTIGYGNYTEVLKGEKIDTKELRAIKKINLGGIKMELEKENSEEEINKELQNYVNIVMNEIKYMKICGDKNENSVKYYESFETENEFVIIMELCDKSLTQLKKGRRFNVQEIYELLSQLNNTFKIMNENKIVHRDLKPDNILIKYVEDNKVIKLCDYCITT